MSYRPAIGRPRKRSGLKVIPLIGRDGPFPWENMFGFHLAGMVGHDFFKPYAVTFDFQNMQIFLQR